MEEPFHIAYDLCKNANTPGFKFLRKILATNQNTNSLENIAQKVRDKTDATKMSTYNTQLNPDLTTHKVYGKSYCIPDYIRSSFTRLRLMSHNLKIETGRWSRIPRENRVCHCDRLHVQNEKHVLLDCPLTTATRLQFNIPQYNSLNELWISDNVANTCNFVHCVLNMFERS